MRKLLLLIFTLVTYLTYSQTSSEYYNSGNDKHQQKNYIGAISDYNKAIKLNPSFISAYINRATSKNKLSDYRGAIIDFSKAIQLNPNDGDAYFNRGNSKYSINDINGACLDWSKAGELGDTEAYEKIKLFCN